MQKQQEEHQLQLPMGELDAQIVAMTQNLVITVRVLQTDYSRLLRLLQQEDVQSNLAIRGMAARIVSELSEMENLLTSMSAKLKTSTSIWQD